MELEVEKDEIVTEGMVSSKKKKWNKKNTLLIISTRFFID